MKEVTMKVYKVVFKLNLVVSSYLVKAFKDAANLCSEIEKHFRSKNVSLLLYQVSEITSHEADILFFCS